MRKLVTALALYAALGACTSTGGTPPSQLEMTTTTADPAERDAGKEVMTAAAVPSGGSQLASASVRQLDAADQLALARTRQSALETAQPNQALAWQNRQSGNSGTIVPGQYYETAQGQYCRTYQQSVTVGGETQQGSGKACRQSDGIWRVVE